jgi:hypothetical protein
MFSVLAANGTNGAGKLELAQYRVDTIEQFQVSVAPYDVKFLVFFCRWGH